jgi:hypothetical protein
LEGYAYLHNVAEHLRRQITVGHLGDVIGDIRLGLWRIDKSVDTVPAEALQIAEETLDRVHGSILRGADPEAIRLLDELDAALTELEAREHGFSA